MAINGLRVSEALGADIEALGIERGHRTLTVLRKGGKVVTIPLAPRTARAIDLAIGERAEGPIFVGTNGERLDRHAAWRIVRRLARRAGINKPVGPHTLRHAFINAALDAGVPLREVQEAASHADPRTTMRYDRARVSLDRHATYIVAAFLAGAAASSGGSRAERPSGGCGGHPAGSICRAGTATRPVDTYAHVDASATASDRALGAFGQLEARGSVSGSAASLRQNHSRRPPLEYWNHSPW